MKEPIFAISLVGLLAACGGGGDDPNSFAFDDPNDAFNEALRISAASSTAGDTPFVNLAPIGSATYQGVAGVTVDDGAVERIMLGTFDLEADFVGNDLSGSATDFVRVEQTGVGFELASLGPVDGTLSISNGDFTNDGGSAAYSADVNGRLTTAGGTTVDVGSPFEGELAGVGAEYIIGETATSETAIVTSPTGVATAEDFDFSIFGERQ